jgi:hypothetical protein
MKYLHYSPSLMLQRSIWRNTHLYVITQKTTLVQKTIKKTHDGTWVGGSILNKILEFRNQNNLL